MQRTKLVSAKRLTIMLALAAGLAGCADDAPLATEPAPVAAAQFAASGAPALNDAIATLQRVTAPYHNIEAAFADGFVLLHPCEERPDEGPVGTVYVHFARLLDGVIDPALPDALIYEPGRNGQQKLVGVEFAIPYPMWTEPAPPTFMGATFQPEDEFGVFALHAWVWRSNPEGMFAESNPRVSCGQE